MNLVKPLKKVMSLAFFIISYATVYSSIEAKRQYEEIRRENIEISRKIRNIEEQIVKMSAKDQGDSHKEEEIICAAIKKDNMSTEVTHTVQEYNGIIGIFDRNGILIREIDIEVSSLPESDKEDLAVGIRVYSSDELDRLIDQFR